MTMTIDNQQRHHLSSIGYDNMPFQGAPQFNNPWGASSEAQYNASMSQQIPYHGLPAPKQQIRPTTMSMPYSSIPATTSTVGTGFQYSQPELMHTSTDVRYETAYTTAPSSSSYAATASSYAPLSSYTQSLVQQQQDQQHRRISPT